MSNTTTEPYWREVSAEDLPSVDAIGNDIHLSLPERPEVFAEKVRLFPTGCRVLIYRGVIVGYGISHPWLLYRIPPLDTFLEKLPTQPDCIFIHDVVVQPHARGHRAAEQFVEIVVAAARVQYIPALALVSVYNTHPLWMRCGFEVIDHADLAEEIQSYGETARYMVRKVL